MTTSATKVLHMLIQLGSLPVAFRFWDFMVEHWLIQLEVSSYN